MRGVIQSFVRNRRWDVFMALYLLALFSTLAYKTNAGLSVNDEIAYLLMVDRTSKGGFTIWNGLNETYSDELVLHGTVRQDSSLYGVPPPLYPILVQPAYSLAGLAGLILVNTLSYVAVVALVYLTADYVAGDKGFASFAAIVYSLTVYSIKYAVELWPHMLSVFMCASAFYLTLRGRSPAAGLLAGLAVGVRYTNGALAAALLIYIIYRFGLKDAAYFALGFGAPVAAILYINNSIFGTVYSTGYSVSAGLDGFSQVLIYPVVFAAAGVSAYVLSDRFGRSSAVKAAASAVLLTALLSYVMDPGFAGEVWRSLQIAYAHLVDMQAHPSGSVQLDKKSILQASPVLALCLLAPALMRNRAGRLNTLLLASPLLCLTAVYSSFSVMHGGRVSFTRYLLEAMPFLGILAAYSLWHIWRSGEKNYVMLVQVLPFSYAFLILAMLRQPGVEGAASFAVRYAPITLAALLLTTAIIRLKTGELQHVFLFIAVACLTYGATANALDLMKTSSSREINRDFVVELNFIPDDSAVVIGDDIQVVDVGVLKIDRRVRIVDASRDNFKDTPKLLEFYREMNIPVYLYMRNSTDAEDEALYGFMEETRSRYGTRIVLGGKRIVYEVGR